MPNRIDIDFEERGFQAVRAAAKPFLTAEHNAKVQELEQQVATLMRKPS